MRHRIAGNRLNRKSSHRQATLRDIAKATLIRQRICTTKAKAKEARKLVDKLITLGKKGSLADKRRAFSILCDHNLVSKLFSNTAPRFRDRAGGYTRIIALGTRRGDNSQLVFLELTEKEKLIVTKAKSKATSKAKDISLKKKEEKASSEEKKVETVETAPKDKDIDKKKEVHKDDVKKADISHDKVKGDKKFIGGIRKMFRRKSDGK